MAGMWIKKSIFTVRIPLIAPTLGGGGADLYIGGPGPPGSYPYGMGVQREGMQQLINGTFAR